MAYSRPVADARARGLFLMEAMWSRFLPAYAVLRDLLGEGRIRQEGDRYFPVRASGAEAEPEPDDGPDSSAES